MNIQAFETALVEKLSKELDTPENWKNNSSGTSSIQHISKDYLLYLSDFDKSVCLISPKLYNFVDVKLTNGIYKKAFKIFEDNKVKIKKEIEEKTRKALIEEFGLESRASKLRALEEISKILPDEKPLNDEKITENKQEIALNLPKKKKRFWEWF